METKIVYQYDENNYFETALTLDDTDRSPSGAWQVPARCVEVAPPAQKEGFKIKWDSSEWQYEAEEKEPEPPKPTLSELKTAKLADVDHWTSQKITGGFTSSCTGAPVRYDSDKDTQLTMQGIALNVDTQLFAEKYPQGCPVRGYAEGADVKSIFMLTPEQVMQWQADLSIHIGTCKQQGWGKQAEVNACTTKEQLDAIILE